ncbi:hypothetical protein L6252_02790, partial [Candidatus Parcubacteria bacterium]|nr:hypothetical protein [Candidatus Parcubacteria bacterium]
MKKTTKISKEILIYLLLGGAILAAASSPKFIPALIKDIERLRSNKKRQVENAFYYMKKNGLLDLKESGRDIRLALTERGRKLAKKYQIKELKIKIPKKWDNKWRIVIFDIPDFSRVARNILRSKLKELNFYSLQKSVWVNPFECEKELQILKEFLGADSRQIRLIIADKIEDDM